MIQIELSHAGKLELAPYAEKVAQIDACIKNKTGAGNDFLGWADYAETYDKEEFSRIQKAGRYIREHFDVLVVCGIGGSYLGARAAIEALNGLLPANTKRPEIVFMGQSFAPSYVKPLLNYLKDKKFAVNVISKSGTTTETAVIFRLLRDLLLEQAHGDASAIQKSIYATTDAHKGALLTLCRKYGYETFVLPDDIGGRYSVMTAVGTLPMAASGIDVAAFMEGFGRGEKEFSNPNLSENPAYQYAVARYLLHEKRGYPVELFVTYEPRFVQLGEWWKQLFGESEGKDGKGLLPDSATFTTDLHSLGQFVQQGNKVLFETVLKIKEPCCDVVIPEDKDNLDGLNYLSGKTLSYVSEQAMEGTIKAHEEVGGVPNLILSLEKMDAEHLGNLMYFFMRACAMSAYLLGVNPFNQPGVEVYKKNMFTLLGKPGY